MRQGLRCVDCRKAQAEYWRFANHRQISSIRSSPRVEIIIIGRLEFAYAEDTCLHLSFTLKGTLRLFLQRNDANYNADFKSLREKQFRADYGFVLNVLR